ncbi:MAG: GNAT family N-acetyltransferase [Lachnospiraceae bacterium]|nr:GNAT family N-acetyltransferase [Lachnospiraceae bacterium]
MITLRKMTGEEFLRFKEYSIAGYAEDLINGQGLSREEALAEAEREFDGTLTEGPETEGQYVMTILDARSGEDVGNIWFLIEEEEGVRQAWLCDFLIYEEQRRKGYGKAALDEMERVAKAAGCAKSALYVWDHNPAGCSLYRKCGYAVFIHENGGAVMKKEL